MYPAPPLERFFRHVQKSDGCWEWTGCRQSNGYARFTIKKGLTMGAHRALWVLTHGPLARHQDVCHTCDNRACVRIDHLFIGARRDNMRDQSRKGRWRNATHEGPAYQRSV